MKIRNGKWELDVTIETIGPAEAKAYLGENRRNRPQKVKSVARRYAADMKDLHWMLTHQAIAFDSTGDLVDGQHRLLAVIEADSSVPFLVVRGVDPATRLVIDGGVGRTAFDTMTIMGFGYTRRQVQVGVRILQGQLRRKPSHPELQDWLDSHRKAVEWADSILPARKILGQVPVATVFARAYYRGLLEKAEHFASVYADPTRKVDDLDDNATLLQGWLFKELEAKKKPKVADVYGKTEKALDAFLKGERLTKLYAAKVELFPLPEESRAPDGDEPAAADAVKADSRPPGGPGAAKRIEA